MHYLKLTALLPFVSLLANMVTADCCYKVNGDQCADGTVGTPYCGMGPCNIFGCNCDGGCRHTNSFMTLATGHGRVIEVESASPHAQVVMEPKHEVEIDDGYEQDFVWKFVHQYKEEKCKTGQESDVTNCLGKMIVDIVQTKCW